MFERKQDENESKKECLGKAYDQRVCQEIIPRQTLDLAVGHEGDLDVADQLFSDERIHGT